MRDLIFNTLQDIGDGFETFKWHLKHPDQANGLKGIPECRLEGAERTKTTDLIMEFYPGSETQVMVGVLKKMDRNDLVLKFTNISKEAPRDVAPPSVGLSQHQSFQPPSTPIGSAVSAGNLPSATPSEPKTRQDFLKYACPLSLDLNTVHNWVSLSAENRKVTYTDQEYQGYHADSQRFADWTQALCSQALKGGRYYWEVQWSGNVVIAASYDDIPRKGAEALFGANGKSWGLICSNGGFALKHNKRETTVCGPRPSRVVGVYLDHPAGNLSFYSVSFDGVAPAKLSLIHKVTLDAPFTKALHPGIGPVLVGSTGELSEIWPIASAGSAVSAGNLPSANPSEPQTRKDFLKYTCPLSLDLNTVHNWVSLSAENRKVTYTDQEYQSYHADSQRFADYTQALCSQALKGGRYYWEVQWSGNVVVAASYDDIPREGAEALFGANGKSWGLICSNGGFTLKHNKREIPVCGPRPSRVVGVYLDHPAGTLSFYSVSFDGVAPAKMSLIHTVTLDAPFTKALHPGIGPVLVGSTGELSEIWPI